MLAFKVITVYLVVHRLKAVIKYRSDVTRLLHRSRAFALCLGEKANCRVLKTSDTNRPSKALVDRCRLTAGDNAVILCNKYATLPLLSSAEAVGRPSGDDLRFHTAKNRSAKREFKECIGGCVRIIRRNEIRSVVLMNGKCGGL